MPQLILDAMIDATQWKALAPDGVTPSTAIQMTNDTTQVRFPTDTSSGKITASVAALNHTLQRALANIDLTTYDDIRLWIQSSRVADSSLASPFFLEMRLASAGMGLADPGNTWRRFLPVYQTGTWELIRLSLSDLPTPVRSAVNLMQLRCVDASVSFVCYLDDVLAVREEMVGDVDAALLARLDKQLTLSGTQVPALFYLPETPTVTPLPYIRLTQYDIEFADERTSNSLVRSDFSPNAYRLHSAGFAYYLYYEIDVLTDTRAHQARILEFILQMLPPRGELLVNSIPLLLDSIAVEALDVFGRRITDRTLLHYRVSTRQESPLQTTPVRPPYQDVIIAPDFKVPTG